MMKPEQISRQNKTRLRAVNLDARAMFDLDAFDVDLPSYEVGQSWDISALMDYPIEWDKDGFHALCLHDESDLFAWVLAVLCESPSAQRMVNEAMEAGWKVALDDLGGEGFDLDAGQGLITLNNQGLQMSALSRSEQVKNAMIINLVRALRAIWQDARYDAAEDLYGVENILMLERVRAADYEVVTALVSYELRSEGFNDAWRYMLGSDYSDIAMEFLRKIDAGYTRNQALEGAFRQWYQNPQRVKTCDHETLEYLDDMMSNHECDEKEEPVFGNAVLTPIAVERYSCLPDKTAYLQAWGSHILTNPRYAGLNDLINQSHFMQIMRDLETVRVCDVPFRDAKLAARIFPKEARA